METNKELVPVGTSVLVEIKKVEEKSDGGIVLSEDFVDRLQMGEVEGILVAIADAAFQEDIEAGYSYPKIGEKVYFKRHSGLLHYGYFGEYKGKVYRIINDRDIYLSEKEMKLEEAMEVKND